MVSRIFRDTESTGLNRRRQIDTLKVFNDNVTEVQEDAEYKVEFTSGGHNMAVIVTLGPDFPMTKPVLKIIPEIVHPWVNERSEVVTAPGLLNYTSHSDLGRVVHAIIREFQLRPPHFSSDGAIASSSQQNDVTTDGRLSPFYGHQFNKGLNSSAHYPLGMPQYPISSHSSGTHFIPRGPNIFPELANLSLDELRKLDESVDRQDEFLLKHHPDTQKEQLALENLLMNIEKVAKENLSKETKLEQLKKNVKMRSDRIASLKSQFDNLTVQYVNNGEKLAPESIRNNLRKATRSTDEESERIAEEFLNKNLDVETFVSSYNEKRTLFYSRKSKEEKLSRQLHELKRAGFF